MSMGRPRFDPRQPQRQFQIRVNHRIRVPEVRVIDANGEMLGVLSTHEALRRAQEQGLDLVEVNPILDSQNQTAVLAAELALSALGQEII